MKFCADISNDQSLIIVLADLILVRSSNECEACVLDGRILAIFADDFI